MRQGSKRVSVLLQDGFVAFRKIIFKRAMLAQDFANGYLRKTPVVFESSANNLDVYAHYKHDETREAKRNTF